MLIKLFVSKKPLASKRCSHLLQPTKKMSRQKFHEKVMMTEAVVKVYRIPA